LIVPIFILVIGVLNSFALFYNTPSTDFQSWTWAGTAMECWGALGMLIGYRLVFKAKSDRAAEAASRQWLQVGLGFLAVSIFWGVRSILAFPQHATLKQAFEFAALGLMTTLYVGWLDTIGTKQRKLRAIRRANRQSP
jgi:hypothetical protein